jgi:hypothetical protein
MVTAALKFALEEDTPTTFSTPDKAKLEILNLLNWLEAHGEYEWPDFQQDGLDFVQAMRLRRALVGDVFVVLNKSGNMKASPTSGETATSESGQDVQVGKRSRPKRGYSSALLSISSDQKPGSTRMVNRKRQCKKENNSDAEDQSDSDEFLAEAMRGLLQRSDIRSHKKDYTRKGESWSPGVLLDMVHDGLVEKWTSPVGTGLLPPRVMDKLKQKQEAWARIPQTPDSSLASQRGGLQSERLTRL